MATTIPGRSRTVLGRQPALWVGIIEAALAAVVSFGGLSDVQYAATMGVVLALAALYLAWSTTEPALASVLQAVKALVGFVAIFGLTITQEQQGMLLALATAAIAFYLRSQASPVDQEGAPNPVDLPKQSYGALVVDDDEF